MDLSNTATIGDLSRESFRPHPPAQAEPNSASAMSWSAVFAGAAGASALSLILLILGTGLGLSSVSPWTQAGISKTTWGISTILWLTFTQLLASGMGGYLAGRLRTRWTEVHRDEIHFRDTAHGFLAWAVSSLVTAALLTSAVGAIVNHGVQAGAAVASGLASTAAAATAGSEATKSDGSNGAMGYFIDALFRPDASGPSNSTVPSGAAQGANPLPTAEVGRIFMASLLTGAMSTPDVRYVRQLVAQRTGLPEQEADKRVTDIYARAQARLRDAQTALVQTADTARKASAYAALWMFVALLSGAFMASLMATLGGRQRDH